MLSFISGKGVVPSFAPDQPAGWIRIGVETAPGVVVCDAVLQNVPDPLVFATQFEADSGIRLAVGLLFGRKPAVECRLAVQQGNGPDGPERILGIQVESVIDVMESLAGDKNGPGAG